MTEHEFQATCKFAPLDTLWIRHKSGGIFETHAIAEGKCSSVVLSTADAIRLRNFLVAELEQGK
jgi:hypothetical protein